MKRVLAFVLFFGACALAMGATKSRYVQYHGIAPGASAAQLWMPYYGSDSTNVFRPSEIDIIVNGPTTAQYFELTVYLPLSSGPLGATDSFTVKPTAAAGTTVLLEYVGPISDTLRVVTPANFAGSAHAFK
jgi:hypothetical protein